MKKILLTGAAGLVGYQTLKELISRNKYEIVATDLKTKDNEKKLRKYNKQITIVYADIIHENEVNNLVKGVNIIIHLAAIIPPLADFKPQLCEIVNVNGTKNIINAINKQESKPFLIYSSSISVYGDRLKNPYIKVGDPLKGSLGDNYAVTKIKTEDMISHSNNPYTIFRLTGIANTNQKTDPLMFHMPLDTKYEICTAEDTARALVNAIEHTDELNNRIFNLSGGKECRTVYREFLNRMFHIFGLNSKYLNKEAFAKNGFHCGYLMDGDDLENILHFRKDNLEDYYKKVQKTVSPFKKIFTQLFSPIIIKKLNKSSSILNKENIN